MQQYIMPRCDHWFMYLQNRCKAFVMCIFSKYLFNYLAGIPNIFFVCFLKIRKPLDNEIFQIHNILTRKKLSAFVKGQGTSHVAKVTNFWGHLNIKEKHLRWRQNANKALLEATTLFLPMSWNEAEWAHNLIRFH